jgi:CheY-like chemotaxis protein
MNHRTCALPALDGAAAQDAEHPGQPRAGARNKRRVLIVEDNIVNQEVARAMLQELDVEATSAWSGEEALEKLAQDRFDAVLMDCQMPNLDGYATTGHFRAWEQAHQKPRTLVVALTANALAGDEERCIAAGMDRYLSKPFTIEQLRDVLQPEGAGEDRSAADAPVAAANIDQPTLDRIRAMNRPNGPDLLIRVIDLYVFSSNALIDTMQASSRLDQSTSLAHAAHALKSSSANVGALTLAELCAEVEAAAKGGKMDLAKDLVKKLILEHVQVLRALQTKSQAA